MQEVCRLKVSTFQEATAGLSIRGRGEAMVEAVRRGLRVGAVLGAVWPVLAACHRQPEAPPILISRITVSEATLIDNAALEVDGDGLKQRLGEALDQTRRFRPLTPEEEKKRQPPASYRARIEIHFTREADELTPDAGPGGAGSSGGVGTPMRRAEVGIGLTLAEARSDGDADQLRAESMAYRIFDPGSGIADGPTSPNASRSRTTAFHGALDAALRQAADDLVLQVDAARKSDSALIADLSSMDAGVRDTAVRQLAERKNPAAVPALIERLKDPDRDAQLRAMGALEGIRDPRAVRPLIDLTDRQDPSFVSQVVYVIGAIGGPDAEAFLFTLQNGASEAQVRHAAAEATAEMKRRHQQAATPGGTHASKSVPASPAGDKR